MINHSHLQPLESDYENIIRNYNNLFSASGICPNCKSRRRGKNHNQLLDILSYEIDFSNGEFLRNIVAALDIRLNTQK
jgi:hypothetical protein